MHVEVETKGTNRARIEIVSDTSIMITRVLAAPRELVFEAITEPEHVRRWYGSAATTMVVCEIDLRVGGKWRYVLRMADGSVHAWSGAYIEITNPSCIVSTETYEPLGPGHEMVATVTLETSGDRTLFRNRLVYPSKADRDGHLQGMEGGMQESFERLDDLVRSLGC